LELTTGLESAFDPEPAFEVGIWKRHEERFVLALAAAGEAI
jgi:hypothetical protein